MVLVALEELIDINPWHGLRFGNLDPVEDAWIERYYVSGSYYDVSLSSKQLKVWRDGRFLFAADGPMEVRHVSFQADRMKFEVRASRAIRLRAGKGVAREYPSGVTKSEEAF